ncbi:MAG: hypothetical protein Tsb0014_05010 [Pleurocapsa sp.]
MERICRILIINLCLCFSVANYSVEAQSNDVKNPTLEREIYFEPPEDGDTPETVGGGTRDPNQLRCSAEESNIQGIMPPGNYGLTSQEHPTVFFYLPQTSAKQVVLAFQDETEDYHQVAFLSIPQDSKIVKFNLGKDRPPLEAGKLYKWKLALVCGEMPDVEDPKLEGWVKRVNLNTIETNLDNKTALERADWYAKHGYWYDLLVEIEKAKNINSEDNTLNSAWQSLLEQAGIE